MDKTPADIADQLIAAEVAKQDAMWGEANARADVNDCQMLNAALAQCSAVGGAEFLASSSPEKDAAESRAFAFEYARQSFYPPDWSGFRDYGSDVANLVVGAAYLRNEIKRRIRAGESTHRASRQANQPYNPKTGLPNNA